MFQKQQVSVKLPITYLGTKKFPLLKQRDCEKTLLPIKYLAGWCATSLCTCFSNNYTCKTFSISIATSITVWQLLYLK